MTQEEADIDIDNQNTGFDSSGIDLFANIPITRISDAPLPLGGLKKWLKQGRNLKFEVNPVDNSGMIYISSNDEVKQDKSVVFPEDTNLYRFKIPDSISDDSEYYNKYLENCFKNFEDLIKDLTYRDFITTKLNQGNEIGVILEENLESKKLENHENQIFLNSTISKLVTDLSILIDDKLSSQETPEDPDYKLIQLEETINILSLINALFFSTTDEILVLLINWVNRADIEPDLEFSQEVLSVEKPYRHTLFWTEYVKKLIMRGLFSQAVNVLNESKYQELEGNDNDLYLIVEDLIILLSNYDTVQFSFDNRKFISWKQKCCELRDNFKNVVIDNKENISIKNAIYEILLIITGLQSAIVRNSNSWYECLLSKYLFELPSESLINEYLEISLSKFPIDDLESLTWERSCIDLIHGKFLKVVKSLEILDKPTATYTSVLFEAKGLYNTYDFLLSNGSEDDNNETISELLLNDHALECLCHQKLIPIGVGILINMNTSITRSVISQYLPKFNCKTNDDLEWCLSICAKLKLNSTASTILKINGNRLFEQGQLYESLILFSKSGDLKILNDKCWLVFENAIITSDKIGDDLINSLILSNDDENGEFEMSDSLRQCLSPYAIFLLFLNFKIENNFTKLIQYLLNLLKFKYLPKKYFPLLLCQLLPFLRNLSTKETVVLNASNEKILSQDNLIEILDLINNFDQSFLQVYQSLSNSKRPSLDQQLIINQYENSQDLYKLSLSEDHKSKVLESDRQYDWRFQLELIEDNNAVNLPQTIEELLLFVRHKISLQIGWCFLEDQ